jgi:hypothetical protein
VPDLVQNGFSLMAGRRHDGVVVIKADHGQDNVLDQGMGGADEAFRAELSLEGKDHIEQIVTAQLPRCGYREG